MERARPVLASLAFALVYVAITSWSLSRFPALRSGLPTASQIAIGLILVLAAGAAGGVIGRGIGASLAALAPALQSEPKARRAYAGVD
jgi:hypothetical protein